ncbi:hypothetical protein [Paraburkholderia tropica]|uniref:hypothetical protein n=1 Tax=Paraburkholderia tropica TaxID=92647 RepID=UPI001601BAB4|nr:hypothetical protein [Paraburkholderia tropica]QNB14050.1 hypothetical protein G5S35_21060 [Paraburkholderia tropica]
MGPEKAHLNGVRSDSHAIDIVIRIAKRIDRNRENSHRLTWDYQEKLAKYAGKRGFPRLLHAEATGESARMYGDEQAVHRPHQAHLNLDAARAPRKSSP